MKLLCDQIVAFCYAPIFLLLLLLLMLFRFCIAERHHHTSMPWWTIIAIVLEVYILLKHLLADKLNQIKYNINTTTKKHSYSFFLFLIFSEKFFFSFPLFVYNSVYVSKHVEVLA